MNLAPIRLHFGEVLTLPYRTTAAYQSLAIRFQRFMSAITLGGITGVFALTHPNRFIGFGFEHVGREVSSFMRAVTESTIGRHATGTVRVVFSSFQFDLLWKTSGNFWFIHFENIRECLNKSGNPNASARAH